MIFMNVLRISGVDVLRPVLLKNIDKIDKQIGPVIERRRAKPVSMVIHTPQAPTAIGNALPVI